MTSTTTSLNTAIVLLLLSLFTTTTTVNANSAKVCHKNKNNGKKSTMTVGQKQLWQHRAHGDTIGPCSNGGGKVTMCHKPGVETQKTIKASQSEAWKHMINHPRDYLGKCNNKPKTSPPKPTDPPSDSGDSNADFIGRNYQSTGDVNDPRVLRATLEVNSDGNNDSRDDLDVIWYGSHKLHSFNIDTIDYVTVQNIDSNFDNDYYTVLIDTDNDNDNDNNDDDYDNYGRPTRFQSSFYKYDMKVNYRSNSNDVFNGVVEFDIEHEGIQYNTITIDIDAYISNGASSTTRTSTSEQDECGACIDTCGPFMTSCSQCCSKCPSSSYDLIKAADGTNCNDDDTRRDLSSTSNNNHNNNNNHHTNLRHRRTEGAQLMGVSQTMRKVLVSAVGCDSEAVDDATMMLDYVIRRDGSSSTKSGNVTGRPRQLAEIERDDGVDQDDLVGWYEFWVPISFNVDSPEDVKATCNSAVDKVDSTCDIFQDSLYLKNAGDRIDICELIVDELSLDGTNEGDSLVEACAASFRKAYQACSILEADNTNNPDLSEICDDLDLDSSSFKGDEWELTTKIMYPFDASPGSSQITVKGDIPRDREISEIYIFDEKVVLRSEPSIVSLEAIPSNPGVNEDYVFLARISCVDKSKGDKVMLSWVGTDGFKGSNYCDVPSTGLYTCELPVGAVFRLGGIKDSLQVTLSSPGEDDIRKSIIVNHED